MSIKVEALSYEQLTIWVKLPHNMPVVGEKLLESWEHLRKWDVKMLYNYWSMKYD